MDPLHRYDRQLLLLGAKRNAVLDLSEVRQYGIDSYCDPDYMTIYGLRPADWYARGVRLLGRTAVECTRDELANAIGTEIAAVAAAGPTATAVVIDPFAGSGNTLYWILRHLPAARALGFELDDKVFALTRSNLSILELPVTILNADYSAELCNAAVGPGELLVAFIAPPWGEALSVERGLDLRHTTPPVTDIVDLLIEQFSRNRLLCAIQVHERLDEISLREVTQRFEWWTSSIYELSSPGENHGLLIGTSRWTPRSTTTAANNR